MHSNFIIVNKTYTSFREVATIFNPRFYLSIGKRMWEIRSEKIIYKHHKTCAKHTSIIIHIKHITILKELQISRLKIIKLFILNISDM